MATLQATEVQVGLPLRERRLWTRQEFEQASALGVFRPEERLELIEGEVREQIAPQRSPHATAIQLVEEALRQIFQAGHAIRVQLPLALSDRSQPEPDLAVVPGTIRDYATQHPATAILVVEVSDSTLAFDRTTKAGLYAKAGIPEYWIVNLVDRRLEVLRQPGLKANSTEEYEYTLITRYESQETFSPSSDTSAIVAVADLLP